LGIHGFLHGLELGSPLALVALALLNVLKAVLGGVLELVGGEPFASLEEGVIDVGSDAVEGDLGGGGEDVGGVDSAEGDSVD
jgi:hypothetical protein